MNRRNGGSFSPVLVTKPLEIFSHFMFLLLRRFSAKPTVGNAVE